MVEQLGIPGVGEDKELSFIYDKNFEVIPINIKTHNDNDAIIFVIKNTQTNNYIKNLRGEETTSKSSAIHFRSSNEATAFIDNYELYNHKLPNSNGDLVDRCTLGNLLSDYEGYAYIIKIDVDNNRKIYAGMKNAKVVFNLSDSNLMLISTKEKAKAVAKNYSKGNIPENNKHIIKVQIKDNKITKELSEKLLKGNRKLLVELTYVGKLYSTIQPFSTDTLIETEVKIDNSILVPIKITIRKDMFFDVKAYIENDIEYSRTVLYYSIFDAILKLIKDNRWDFIRDIELKYESATIL